MNRKKIIIIAVVFFGIISVIIFPRAQAFYYRNQMERENSETLQKITSKDVIAKTALDAIQSATLKPVIPERAYLKVPFFCQAPMTNDESWKIHHASCEEAALLQAVYYDKNITEVDLNKVDQTLRDMVAWQENHFGVHKDIHADSVKILMMNYFGYTSDEIVIIRKASLYEIKEQVAAGFPVIAPTYGRLLKNPFYKQPGPEYHMVTIIGYTEDRIITNDVGTKRGKDYSYKFGIFKTSMDKEGGDVLVIRSKRGVQAQ